MSNVHVWSGEFGGGARVCMYVYKDAAAEAACAGPLEPPLRVGVDGDAAEGVDGAGDASDAVAELHEDLAVGSEADADAPTPAPDLFVAASGGAASSGAPPPPPPPAHEALYPANAVVTFFVEGSAKIVSYHAGFVEVTCNNPARGRCRVARSMKSAGPRAILRNPGHGAPARVRSGLVIGLEQWRYTRSSLPSRAPSKLGTSASCASVASRKRSPRGRSVASTRATPPRGGRAQLRARISRGVMVCHAVAQHERVHRRANHVALHTCA